MQSNGECLSVTGAKDPTVDLDAALDRLHLVINQLEALVGSKAQRAELDTLRRSALRLGGAKLGAGVPPLPAAAPEKPGLRQFEPARFRRLLELAGPENGAELLARLSEDLIAMRDQSVASFDTMDWPGLRAASHVLISLAGSVGAVSLQGLAERMNAATHAKDGTGISMLMPDTLIELEALIDVVAKTQPLTGGQA